MNAQSRATDKWQSKIGLVSKTYKLKKDVADRFKKKCEEEGKSQAQVLTELMERYINNT